MKKTLLIAASLIIAGATQAQDAPKMWVSGSAQFKNYSDDDDTKITGGNFSPGFGYCINEKIAVGIGLSYESTKTEEDFDGTKTTTTASEFSAAPFFRYYKSVGEKCSLYGEVNVGFGSGKEEYSTEGSEDDTYSFLQAGIAPGVQYWFHNHWSINAEWGALRYRSDNDKGDVEGQDDFKSSNLVVGLDLSSISFGLNFHF